MTGINPDIVVLVLKVEYVGAWRETKNILALVKPHTSQGDYDQMHRILTQGCLSVSEFHESNKSKTSMINREK